MSKRRIYLLAVLMIGAFLIRIVAQPTLPYGFHRDEAGILYSAYSITETLRDEWGRFLPLHFKALGDYPPGMYNYFVALTIPFLGLSQISERLPAIIFGTLMVPLVYLFIIRVFKSSNLALVTAFLVVINPWDVVQSRAASEALVALFFSLSGILLYYESVKQKKKRQKLLIGALICYFIALYTYNAARVGLPLIHGLMMVYLWSDFSLKEKKKQIAILIGLFLFSAFSVFATSGRSMSFNNTSILNIEGYEVSAEVAFIRESSLKVPILVSRIFTNKPVNLLFEFIDNYFSYFNYGFLFNDGGFHRRYLVPEVGPLLVFYIPFIFLGLTKYSALNSKQRWMLLSWILLAPIASAVTEEATPNVKRSMFLFLPILILTASGLLATWQILKNQRYINTLVFSGLAFVLCWNFAFFLKQYVVHTKYVTTQHRSYGYFKVFAKTDQLDENYEKVIVYENVDTPHTYFLIHKSYPPAKYQAIPTEQKRNLFDTEKQPVSIENYWFMPGSCPLVEDLEENSLYILPAGCFNELDLAAHMKLIDKVFSTDDSPLFYIAEPKE